MVCFHELTELKSQLDKHTPLLPETVEILDEKFKIQWTYNSNPIEGNTLSLQETTFFLQERLTSKGKTLKEYFKIENHAEAIEFLKVVVNDDRPITESLIKELHSLLLRSIDYICDNRVKKPIYPGKYKTQPNHVITMDGSIHDYTDPVRLLELTQRFG